MSRLTSRRLPRPDMAVDEGERPLAWAVVEGGDVVGTRDALYLASSSVEPAETVRIPWEQVQAADWDPESATLRVSEVGTWGQLRPAYKVVVVDPGRILELVRERVTASVLLQRLVPVSARHSIRVIARRAPRGDQPISWLIEYDEGLDPDDPVVRLAVEAALATVRDELGLG